jgi:hypothetical protein
MCSGGFGGYKNRTGSNAAIISIETFEISQSELISTSLIGKDKLGHIVSGNAKIFQQTHLTVEANSKPNGFCFFN